MPTIKVEQLEALIEKGLDQTRAVFLFDGNENWLKDRFVQNILDRFLPKEARDTNLDRFQGGESQPSNIVNAALSMPFLSERRVILVSATEEFSSAEAKIVGEIIEGLPSSTILIFLYDGKAGLREEIPARVSSYGTLVTFWTPFPNKKPQWILDEVRLRGKTMSYEAAKELAEASGDLQDISQALDKLILFVGKKPQIELFDIESLGLNEGVGDYQRLEEALWNRNMKEALTQVELLSEMGVRAESLLPLFERVFRQLFSVQQQLKEKEMSLEDIFSKLGMRGLTKQNWLRNGLRLFTEGQLSESFNEIVQAHYDLKTGFLTSQQTLLFLTLHLLKPLDGRRGQVRT